MQALAALQLTWGRQALTHGALLASYCVSRSGPAAPQAAEIDGRDLPACQRQLTGVASSRAPVDNPATPTSEEEAMTKDHGSSVKDDKQYEGLRKQGMSKSRASLIAGRPGNERPQQIRCRRLRSRLAPTSRPMISRRDRGPVTHENLRRPGKTPVGEARASARVVKRRIPVMRRVS
jgi:hypothetical protein